MRYWTSATLGFATRFHSIELYIVCPMAWLIRGLYGLILKEVLGFGNNMLPPAFGLISEYMHVGRAAFLLILSEMGITFKVDSFEQLFNQIGCRR